MTQLLLRSFDDKLSPVCCRSGVLGLDAISPGRGRSGRSRGRPKGSGGAAKSGGKGRGRKSTAGSAAAMAGEIGRAHV